MYKFQEEIKYITMFESPETDEATALLNKKLQEQRLIKFILFFTTLTLIIAEVISVFSMIHSITPFILFSILNFIMIIVDFKILSSFSLALLPYKQLLKIAKRNDEIRHEERIRECERKRINGFFRRTRIITQEEIDKTINR